MTPYDDEDGRVTSFGVPGLLGLAQVQDILDQREYKPGWVLDAYVGDTTGLIHVQLRATVEDSYDPDGSVPLHVVSPVPPYALLSELDFDKWLAHRLIMIEVHESQEWYRKPRANGEGWTPVFNPHREGADRDRWPIEKRVDP